MKAKFNFINNRQYQAQVKAQRLKLCYDRKEKGDTNCLMLLCGHDWQYHFYPISNSERYIKSLKDLSRFITKDFTINELIEFIK